MINIQALLDSGMRYVQLPAGIITITSPLRITTNGQTVDFSACVIVCNFSTDQDAIVVGNLANYNAVSNVTLLNPCIAPNIPAGKRSLILVAGQKTRIINVTSANVVPGATFGHMVTVLGDQAFLLDGLDTTAGGFNITSTPAFTGSWVYAPGPFHGTGGWGTGPNDNAAVGWLKHMQLSCQWQGNGVDWLSGNTLKISDSVIQGVNQFAVRSGVRRGGYGGTVIDNVYMENPAGATPIGTAGVIINGGDFAVHGTQAPRGQNPTFAQTGPKTWLYYVAINSQTGPYNINGAPWNLDSVPLFLGSARVDGVTPVKGTFPVVNGAGVYRILRIENDWQNPNAARPQGTGNWLVATVLQTDCVLNTTVLDPNGSGVITGGVGTFVDNPANAPAAYTTVSPTQPNRDATYNPDIWLWPGDVVLTGANLLPTETPYFEMANTFRPGN